MSKLNEDFLNYLYNTTNEAVNRSSAELYGIARSGLEGFLYSMCLVIIHKEIEAGIADGILYQIESTIKNSEALGVTFDQSLKDSVAEARTAIQTKRDVNQAAEPGDNFDELW